MDHSPRRRFNMRIFGGSSHPELTRLVAKKVGVRVGNTKLRKFANKETNVELTENVRGQSIYVIQSGGGEHPNDSFMELVFLINAFRLAAAGSITVITPYFPYSKGDQKDTNTRVPIAGKLVADLIKTAGAKHLMMLDPHTPQLEGFFSLPVDSLKVEPFFCEWIKKNIPHWEECIVVSPDEGGVKRSVSVANDLNLDFALIHNRNKPNKKYSQPEASAPGASYSGGAGSSAASAAPSESQNEAASESGNDEGAAAAGAADRRVISPVPRLAAVKEEHERRSRSPSSTYSGSRLSTSERVGCLSGSVNGRTVIIVDDMIDTASTLKFAADVLEREGADNIYVLATHGLFSGNAREKIAGIRKGFLSSIVVSNSVPQEANLDIADDFHVIDISGLIAEYIRRHHYKESVMVLSQFQPIRDEPHRLLKSLTGLGLHDKVDEWATADSVLGENADNIIPEGTAGPPRYGFRMRSVCWE